MKRTRVCYATLYSVFYATFYKCSCCISVPRYIAQIDHCCITQCIPSCNMPNIHTALHRVCMLHYTCSVCLWYIIEMVQCCIKQRCPCFVTQRAHVACYGVPCRPCSVGTMWCVIHRVQNMFGCNIALSVGLLVVTWDRYSFGATFTETSIVRLGKPKSSPSSIADCSSVPGISSHWCSQCHIFRALFITVP